LLAASIAFDYRHKEKDSVVAAKKDLQRGIATMDATKNELEQTKKDSLPFPTDAAALLFGLLIFSVAIFALRRGFLSDPDTYWHIATAKWMLAERALPSDEIFSHTAAGQPWVNIEWLAQIILFSIYDWFGWRGLVLLCGLVIALTFVLLYVLLARELRPTVALGAAAVSFAFASSHFLARPHLLTFPIIVVWTAFLARASDENRRPSLWLLPLMVLWANLHGGFTLGLVLAAGFGLEATIAAPAAERRRVAIYRLSLLLRNRIKLRLKIRALSSEGRLSAVFLSAMPFLLVLIINLMHPAYFWGVRHHEVFVPAIGFCLLLLACGNVVMYRMVNFKY
jgi:hypothetical protein